MATTRLTPPLKMHGGKGGHQGKLARWIISRMRPHRNFVEPFFGGSSVLLAKDPDNVCEIANDLNHHLVHFWQTLRDGTLFPRFVRLAEVTEFGEGVWAEAGGKLDDPDPAVRAWAFFVRCRQSLAGRLRDFATVTTRRTRRRMCEQTSAWLTAVEGLPAVHARLQRVMVLCGPALDVIPRYDSQDTCFYLDPPYMPPTRTAKRVYGRYEMTEADHAALLHVLKECQGQVLVSNYANEMYDRELAGWARHVITTPNHAAHGKSKRRMVEVLWVNHD
jgi:DNA adenine methylase